MFSISVRCVFALFHLPEGFMHGVLFDYLAIKRMASLQAALIALKANRPANSTNPNPNRPATSTKGEPS